MELDEADVRLIVESARLISKNKKKEAKDIRDFKNFGDHTYIDVQDLLGWIENLNYELEHQIDEYRDLENDLENNYERKCDDDYEYYGVSRRDFM